SRNGPCRSFQIGMVRHCLSLPSLVSTTIRRAGVSTTSAWIDIFRRPSSVAKCGISQGNRRISSLPAEGRMNRVWPTVSSSTILVILTRPIVQRIRRQRLHGAGEGAAVEQDVLPRNKARFGAAQEGAGQAELVGFAEASGRI